MSSRLVSLLGSTPFKEPGLSTDYEKFKWGHYLKEILILNSFSFGDKDPRFTKLKPDLTLAKIKVYTLFRAVLLFTLFYEIPCI